MEGEGLAGYLNIIEGGCDSKKVEKHWYRYIQACFNAYTCSPSTFPFICEDAMVQKNGNLQNTVKISQTRKIPAISSRTVAPSLPSIFRATGISPQKSYDRFENRAPVTFADRWLTGNRIKTENRKFPGRGKCLFWRGGRLSASFVRLERSSDTGVDIEAMGNRGNTDGLTDRRRALRYFALVANQLLSGPASRKKIDYSCATPIKSESW